MCGLAGILLSPQRRTQREIDAIADMFSRLLLHSEHRGPYATGAMLMTTAGEMVVEKGPLPAHRFVATNAFRGLCARISTETTVMMGHTRWPTQGSHRNNNNNQPLIVPGADGLAVTHNGNIPQVTRYFDHFHLDREWEVDSELILRLACRHRHPQGIGLQSFLRDIAVCTGHLAAVLVSAAQPETVIFIRRDRPLHLAWHPTKHLLAYASEPTILDMALHMPLTWQHHALTPETALVVSCTDLSMSTVLQL